MKEDKIRIAGVSVLYNPTEEDFANIITFAKFIDFLILIDNSEKSHQSDIDSKMKGELFTLYKYIKSETNIGLSGGINLGIKEADEAGFPWCLFMDQDSSVDYDIVSIYFEELSNIISAKVAILGPQYKYDRVHLKACEGIYPARWLMASGCLFNVKIFMMMNGYMNELFLDGCDLEYCLRVKKEGYEIYECRRAIINHRPAITKEKRILGLFTLKYGWDKPIRYYYQSRSLHYIIKKYHSLSAIRMYIIKFLKILLIFDDKNLYLRAWFKGHKDAE